MEKCLMFSLLRTDKNSIKILIKSKKESAIIENENAHYRK